MQRFCFVKTPMDSSSETASTKFGLFKFKVKFPRRTRVVVAKYVYVFAKEGEQKKKKEKHAGEKAAAQNKTKL